MLGKRSILRRVVDSTLFSLVIGGVGFGVLYSSNRTRQTEQQDVNYENPRQETRKTDYYGLLGAGIISLAVLNAGRAAISRSVQEKREHEYNNP
jgi:hypothetical protein